ncbi:MAG: hypothetical protein ABR615_04750 [Pseudonocardiaceae bacterium]
MRRSFHVDTYQLSNHATAVDDFATRRPIAGLLGGAQQRYVEVAP